MSKSHRKFTSAFEATMHRQPWLYGLIVLVVLGMSALILIVVFQKDDIESAGNFIVAEKVVTMEIKTERATIQNILNGVHLRDSNAPDSTLPSERHEMRIKDVDNAIKNLESLNVDEELIGAKDDLLTLMRQWHGYLLEARDTGDLRFDFIALGKEHPWLNTILWIILLNQL